MVGYAKIFSDFIESPDFLEVMLTRLTDIEIEFNKAIIDECGEYLDWMRLSPEDLASEKTAFLSLKMFERQVKPHYVRAFNEIKEYYLKKNPLGKIQFHSCGAIPEPFMRGLIESGVDGYDSLPPKVARHSNPAAKKATVGEGNVFLWRNRRAGNTAVGQRRGRATRSSATHLGNGARWWLSAEFISSAGARCADTECACDD
jgi:uroporphyrinogen decarboxylase